ncbi:hypothetical protein KC19_2G219000, partial [Ceratodon purpureus]
MLRLIVNLEGLSTCSDMNLIPNREKEHEVSRWFELLRVSVSHLGLTAVVAGATMRGRSPDYSPRRSYDSPPRRGYGDRRPSPTPPPRGGRGGYGREPEMPTSLLVRNIPRDCTPEDLRVHFKRYGTVKDVYLPKDFYTR